MAEDSVSVLVEPLVRQGLFDTPEHAIAELAEDYVLRQVRHYQEIIAACEGKHGMTYQQFDRYLQQRTKLLQSGLLPPDQLRALGQAIMSEEDDALEWKIAREMLQSWLGLRAEVVP